MTRFSREVILKKRIQALNWKCWHCERYYAVTDDLWQEGTVDLNKYGKSSLRLLCPHCRYHNRLFVNTGVDIFWRFTKRSK